MYLNKKKYEDGMILKVDKPIGWTSFDIVNKKGKYIGLSYRHN